MNPYLTSPTLSASHDLPAAGRILRALRGLDSVLGAVMNTLSIWDRRHRDRLHLASLDHRMLRDIGISSADVHHEASKPFWRA